ncbi:hypothetical protein Q3G72_024780 [Acer saccharum]|nr:hypothetical protein Q3G72_024780 [Acer saccharum]
MRNSTSRAKATPAPTTARCAPPCLAAPGHSSGTTMDVSSALAAIKEIGTLYLAGHTQIQSVTKYLWTERRD